MKKLLAFFIVIVLALGGVFGYKYKKHLDIQNEIAEKNKEIRGLEKAMPYLHVPLTKAKMSQDQQIQFLKRVQTFIKSRETPYSIDPYGSYPKKKASKIKLQLEFTWTNGGLQEVYNTTTTNKKSDIKLYKEIWQIGVEQDKKDEEQEKEDAKRENEDTEDDEEDSQESFEENMKGLPEYKG